MHLRLLAGGMQISSCDNNAARICRGFLECMYTDVKAFREIFYQYVYRDSVF